MNYYSVFIEHSSLLLSEMHQSGVKAMTCKSASIGSMIACHYILCHEIIDIEFCIVGRLHCMTKSKIKYWNAE